MVKTIVSLSDFNNELLIAGVENPNLGVNQDICAMISEREPEYLTNLLGYGLYKDVWAGITTDPDNVPQPIADLVNGCDYDVFGALRKWEGLRKHTAQYVYYWYQRMAFTRTAVVGEVKPNAENSTLSTARFKMGQAYNSSVRGYWDCQEFLSAKKADYPLYRRSETKQMHVMNTVF